MAENETVIPDEIKDFVELLKDHEVKEGKAISIGKFISRTGSSEVFEQPEELANFLARYPRDLAPVQRRRILEQWFAEKGVSVPEELLTKTAMHPKDLDKAQKDEEKKKKVDEGTVWTVEVDDKGMPKIRMIKEAGEPGTTLEEATKAAKQIAKEFGGEESVVVYNESLGKHMPNFKSDFVKNNLGVAWAAARQMDQAVATGEPIDPMDTFLEQMAKIESMKELVGAGRKEPETKGTVGEIISAIKELRTMSSEGKEMPEWMRDPVLFQKTVQELVPKGDTDTLKEVRDELTQMRGALHESELKHKDEQIGTLAEAIRSYRNEVSTLKSDMEKSKQITGRSAYDLLGDLITKVPDKEDIRQMVTEAVGKVPKLVPRGAADRGRTLEAAATSIEAAAEVKTFADDWFRLG